MSGNHHGVTIRLLFTESGHGKSPCDGVGGNIKTEVENALLKRHGEKDLRTIHSAEVVKDVIKKETPSLIQDKSAHSLRHSESRRKTAKTWAPDQSSPNPRDHDHL